MNFFRKLVITGLGTGYLRPAPGTWGSAAAVAAFLAVAWLACGNAITINVMLAVILVLSSIGCVAFGKFAETAFGKKDPSYCTVDEWAGQALTLMLLPYGVGTSFTGWLIVAGVAFFAFRFFDIVKPPPARQMEKLPHGWGVLIDDLFAGVYANIAAQLVLRIGLPLFAIAW
ncbi:MAG: phosphatidylglycerophosphatase A [Planctomycetaceae bacterium]|nr:MAG: phosphatidylglycerophosphatase A [Planctomycetaceae bacterium]